MKHLKIIKVGDSLGVALPPEVLASLGLVEGALSAPDAGLQEQLRVAREIMERHRDLLRELAKS